MKQAVWMVLAGVALTGCAGSGNSFMDSLRIMSGKSVVFVEPITAKQVAPYRQVLLTGSGNGGSELLATLEQQMHDTKVNGMPYYNQILRSGKKGSGWMQLDASVIQWQVNPGVVTESRSKCLNNKMVCTGSQGVSYNVTCNVLTATVTARLRVSDAATDSLLGSKNLTESRSSKTCTGEGGTLSTPQALLQETIDGLVPRLLADFVPKQVKRPLDLKQDDPVLAPESRAQFTHAYQQAAAGDIVTAGEIYQRLLKAGNDKNANVLFNAAFVEHAQGHFAAADKLYQQAAQLPQPPDELQKYATEAHNWVMTGVANALR